MLKTLAETVFERSYSTSRRIAAVRAATTVVLHSLPKEDRFDLEQEALLELWRKHTAYDSQRGSWRTFSERVVANRVISVLRSMYSQGSGQFREDPLENIVGLAAPSDGADLRTDVLKVLARVSPFDRSVAVCLVGHSATETGHRLGVSRAAVYRAIGRLRVAFTVAGLAGIRSRSTPGCRPNHDPWIDVRRKEPRA